MKANESNSKDAIWACLHGELDANARNALEQEMARDSELRARFESARELDRMLRATLPIPSSADQPDGAIVEQALAAWERDQAAAAQPEMPFSEPALLGLYLRRSLVGVAGLAAAAALVLAVSPVLHVTDGVSWTAPVGAALTLRGPDSSSESSARDVPFTATRCQEMLRASLAKTLETRGGAVPRATLSLRLQELRRGGAFSVVVTAVHRDGRVVGEWSGDYSGVEAFLSSADASAARIAETLGSSGKTVSAGGMP